MASLVQTRLGREVIGEESMHGFIRYSFTVVAAFCLVAFAGERAGSASAAGEPARASDDAVKARDLYVAQCSACHQTNGDGLPGVFPPLKGSAVVNRDDATKHIQAVLNGMQGARVSGVVYASVMPPFSGTLNDADIADIINFERRSWGNHGQPVTATQVAAERAKLK
jgi:cytochrome c oxidase cbb3-type subunit 2